MVKGCGFRVAKEKGDVRDLEMGIPEQLLRDMATGLVQQRDKGRPFGT